MTNGIDLRPCPQRLFRKQTNKQPDEIQQAQARCVLNSGHHLFFMTLWVVWKLEKKWSNHRQTCLRRFPGVNIDYNQHLCCLVMFDEEQDQDSEKHLLMLAT